MPRFDLSDLPAGVNPPAGFREQSITAAKWNHDSSKPFGDGEQQAQASHAVTLGSGAKEGTAFDNLGVGDNRGTNQGAADIDLGSGFGDDRTDTADAFLIGPRTCGPIGDDVAPKDAGVAEIASAPGRVCGPLDGSTGNVSLDKILAQFEGMDRFEIRREMRDWDRADVRDFREDFRAEFGVGFAQADWLWG